MLVMLSTILASSLTRSNELASELASRNEPNQPHYI